jgi:arylsulfatase A-like enzyme
MAPSILFLIVDCLRADRASAQADLANEGFLARLLRTGYSFTNAVTVTPTTTPAVASMLTGCYPFEHGVRGLSGFTLPAEIPTLARSLRELGYRTEAYASGPLRPELKLFEEFDHYEWVRPKLVTLHGAGAELLTSRIRELDRNQRPWFLLYHIWDLHEKRRIPPGFSGSSLSRTLYDRALAALDERLTALLPPDVLDGTIICLVGDHGENLNLEPRGRFGSAIGRLLWWKPTRGLLQPIAKKAIARGARSRSKRLLRLAPRALFTHGHHLLDPLLRVPLVLAGGGLPIGASSVLVTHTDLAPALVSLAGGWFGGGVGAQPLSYDGSGDPERRVFLETAWVTALPGVRQIGLRTHRWKYFELADGEAPALFDLESDPRERRNVVDRFPEVASALGGEVHAAFAAERLGDRMSDEHRDLVERRLMDLGYFN